MSLLLVAPGLPMHVGSGRLALWEPLRTAVAQPGTGGGIASLATIPGLAGWWDAGLPAGMLGVNGQPPSGWGSAVSAIADRTGVTASILPYSAVGSASAAAFPRLSGSLGGSGLLNQAGAAYSPALDPQTGFRWAGSTSAAGTDGTWYFVWSRPNWRQGSGRDASPVTLLSSGAIPILQCDSAGGSGRLMLFPNGNRIVLSTAMERRHTHSLILRFQAGGGLDVWLDDHLVVSGAVNQSPMTAASPMLFLHDGTSMGSAQCWFHEAATWPRALSDLEINQTMTYASRWHRGGRRGVLVVINGQSNAINFALNDGAAMLLAQGIAWYTGAAAYNVLATTGSPTSYTMQAGHGIYPAVGGTYPGSFLNNPGDGSDPSTWSAGADGLAVRQALSTLSADDLNDVCAIMWPWNETDSLRNYGELSTFTTAASRFLALERTFVGKPAASVPLIWWSAIPYGSDGGMLMHRNAVASLAADGSQNVVIGVGQTTDSNPRGSSWDPTTGQSSGGDSAHRDSLDHQRFARLAAPIAARAVIAAGSADSITSINASVPASGGPSISHVYRETDTSLLVTIRHDAGSDLRVPLQAAAGIGLTVMDGGSAAVPGTLVTASSCIRVDATHLRVTLAAALRNGSSLCHLYYPYGQATIGRGNAITDNYSSVPKPAGWDIAADLGSSWSLDWPLAAPAAGVVLSDTPT
jgi:hypothetical protein